MRNVDIISGLYQAFGRGDLPSVLELLHPAVSWHEAEGSPYHPGRNGWTGPDAIVENLFAKMGDDWAEFTVHPTQLHDAGDLVVVEGRYSGQHQATGKTLDCQVCHIWTVEGGKVTRFQQYVDTAQLQDVMGARSG